MKIAVIGAGVAGIATAYELARAGHAVTVFDGNSAVAEAGSFATGPLLAPSMLGPLGHASWPGAGWMGSLLRPSHIRLQRGASLADVRWLLRWKSPELKAFEDSLKAQNALIRQSAERFHAICHDEGFQVERGDGQLLLLENEKQLAELQPKLDWLKANGTPWKSLSAAEAQKIEPALFQNTDAKLAIHFPDDVFANCRQFVQLQKDCAQSMGVQFELGNRVTGFSSSSGVEVHTSGAASPHTFEQVVLCTGAHTHDALQMLGLRLPLAHIQSYSLSAGIREPLNAPRAAVFDMATRTSIVRVGARIRITGGAELGPGTTRHHAGTVKSLYQAMQTNFPGAIHQQTGTQLWKGTSVFSADGAPLIGPSTTERFWLNTAHGHQGWGMACGAARLLTTLVSGKTPDIDPTPFSPGRFSA